MEISYLSSLPEGLENQDFRVIAPEGGYHQAISDVEADATGQTPLVVHAQVNDKRITLKIYVTREQISRDGVLYKFDGFNAEILVASGGVMNHTASLSGTDNFVLISALSIDPRPGQKGQTVGMLKMKATFSLPTTTQEGA